MISYEMFSEMILHSYIAELVQSYAEQLMNFDFSMYLYVCFYMYRLVSELGHQVICNSCFNKLL